MHTVFKDKIEMGFGTLTECIDYIACQLSQFNPEQVTEHQAHAAGYQIKLTQPE